MKGSPFIPTASERLHNRSFHLKKATQVKPALNELFNTCQFTEGRIQLLSSKLAMLLLFCAGVSLADEGDCPTHRIENLNVRGGFEYVVSGKVVEGRLLAQDTSRPFWKFSPCEGGNDSSSVYLHGHDCGPSPFSAPFVVVTVLNSADFRLDVLGENTEPIDSFSYADVTEGVYYFAISRPVMPKTTCVVRLVLKGDPAGEVRSDTFLLARLTGERN